MPSKLSGEMVARIAVVVTALVLAAPAGASVWPAPPPFPQHAPAVLRAHAPARTHSCMAQQARAKIARWLLPVACEQPPRSQLLLVTPLFGGA
jgi:hypothetical protein